MEAKSGYGVASTYAITYLLGYALEAGTGIVCAVEASR